MAIRKWTSPRLSLAFSGDEESARAMVSQARSYAGYLFDQMKGDQTFGTQKWEFEDGSSIRVWAWDGILGQRAAASIYAPPGAGFATDQKVPFFALTWFPSGLCVTPKSGEAPYGYGFPKRDRLTGEKINAPYGTMIDSEENMALNQVLFNRYQNNKYLDSPAFISGEVPGSFGWPDNPRLRESVESALPSQSIAPYVHWSFGYTPTLPPEFDRSFWEPGSGHNIQHVDEPGYNLFFGFSSPVLPYRIKKVESEFEPLFRQVVCEAGGFNFAFYEEESDEWFCHWPEELLYENTAFEAVFQETNRLRDEAGRKPVTRAIRGFANGADRTAVEIAMAGVLAHDSPLYRSGYNELNSRISAMGNNARLVVENIAATPFGNLRDEETGEKLVLAWENSPPHYQNMVSEDWDKPAGATSLNAGGGYRAPGLGYSFCQWFEQRERWLYGGLFSNDTPFGPVSIRSLGCYLFLSVNLYEYAAYGIYFSGREYIINQVIDNQVNPESTNTMCVVGATAFLKNDQVWLRAIVFISGTDPGMRSYICPIANAAPDFSWTEEAHISFDPGTPGYLTTGFSFSSDGMRGICGMSFLSTTTATPFFKNTNEPLKKYFYPWDIGFDASSEVPTFTITKKDRLPKIHFTVKTEPDGDTTVLTSFEQAVSGTASLHSFYVGDDVKTLNYVVDMRCYQHRVNQSEFHCNDTLVFPSGKRLPVVRQNLINGFPVGECYLVSFLYIDPRTENCVYAKINLRRDRGSIYGTLRFYYNDILLKTYSEKLIADHYDIEEPHISAVWNTANGPSDPQYVSSVYDISFLRAMDVNERLYPLPLPDPLSGRYHCRSAPSIYCHSGAISTGTYSVSAGNRATCNFGCYTSTTGAKPSVFWSYEMSIPGVSEGSIASSGVDTVRCEFAQYQDRVAIDILFHKICKITADNEEDGDHILYTNFDISEEVGIGPITSLMPLGVV